MKVEIVRRFFLVVFSAFALVVTGFTPAPKAVSLVQLFDVGDASAQSARKKRRGLFSVLFGRRSAKKKSVRTKNRRSTKRRSASRKKSRKRSRRKRSVAASVPKVAAVVKEETALKVLVIGDFLAGGIADGLEDAYADLSNIVVVDKSNGLSGFVRNDIVDWPNKIQSLVEEVKPSHIVAMLGSNDRQQLRENGKKYNKRTPDWDVAYKKRIEAFATSLKATGISYSWVGLPPMRLKRMSVDFLFFNEIYSAAATTAQNGKFIDVWDGFSDADGNYSRSGPDVSGQIVMLRPKDGINLNKAGRRRLAFYVQDDIRKQLLGDAPIQANPSLSFDIESQLPKKATYDPAKSGRTVVIRLNDPSIDGADILAGEEVKLEGGVGNGFKIPTQNAPVPTVRKEGRVDNHRWPPSAPGSVIRPTAAAAQN